MQKLILIDNYDSFTHTINNYFITLGLSTEVIKNDDDRLLHLEELNPTYIVLSPGPGHPDEAGFTLEVIKKYDTSYPFLGICLGHQSLMQAFGSKVTHANEIMHGKTSKITHSGTGLFKGISQQFNATRYHSLVIDPLTVSDDLEVTGWTYDKSGQKVIMAFQHKKHPLFGLQFHPEAILTEFGYTLLRNFIKCRVC